MAIITKQVTGVYFRLLLFGFLCSIYIPQWIYRKICVQYFSLIINLPYKYTEDLLHGVQNLHSASYFFFVAFAPIASAGGTPPQTGAKTPWLVGFPCIHTAYDCNVWLGIFPSVDVEGVPNSHQSSSAMQSARATNPSDFVADTP
jgi:hypothetical protein